MGKLRPDRVVQVLTAIASVAYFGLWVGAILILTALPMAKMFGGPDTKLHYALELPVTAADVTTVVHTAWGPAPLKLADLRGKLELPIPMLPWSLVVVLWAYAALGSALMLLFLHNLRRIFQRVRDGAPFDMQNAVRLRTLGVLLLAGVAVKAIAQMATWMVVRRGLAADSPLAAPSGLHIDTTFVLVALVLMALAEVFRRGADLEDEQSLVV